MAMDKYGVYTGPSVGDLDKQAQRDGCPQCGGRVALHGNVKMCARCGSKPFESNQGEPDLRHLRKENKR